MDEPRKKDIKVINQKPNLLQGFPIEYFKGNPPPQNDSSKVKIELRKLSDLPHDIDFVKESLYESRNLHFRMKGGFY